MDGKNPPTGGSSVTPPPDKVIRIVIDKPAP